MSTWPVIRAFGSELRRADPYGPVSGEELMSIYSPVGIHQREGAITVDTLVGEAARMVAGFFQNNLLPDTAHVYTAAADGSVGIYTWTKPTDPYYYGSFVAVFGPGGPGGGVLCDTDNAVGGAGGGGGGCALGYYAAEALGSTETVTVGGVAVGGDDTGETGAQGTSTSFTTNEATLQATGGNPGAGAVAQPSFQVRPGGVGGIGSGSPLGSWANMRGAPGGYAICNHLVTDVMSGNGGGTAFFGGGSIGKAPVNGTVVAGVDGVTPGSGGGGAAGRGVDPTFGYGAKGGDGQSGLAMVFDLYALTS